MIIEAAVCTLGESANFPGELPTVAVVKMLAISCHIQFGKKHEQTDSIRHFICNMFHILRKITA